MQVIIDIETVPGQTTTAKDAAREGIKPPATLKKAESIAAWWAEEADKAAEDAYNRQGLDGGNYGEIVSIAAVNDAGQTWTHCRTQQEAESSLLAQFAATVQGWLGSAAMQGPDGRAWPIGEPFFIAHNAAFDMGFVWRRCIVNGVKLPFRFPNPSARAGQHFGDTMTLWAGWGQRVSLDTLCRVLGVTSPKAQGFDGSQVHAAWLAGEYERIAAYNLADAQATAEVWHRLNGGRA